MARKKGQTYSAEQKAKIVLELLKEEQTIGQLATKYKVTAKSITNWKKQFLENASKAFEDSASAKERQKELEKLRQENDELAKTLGRTTVERDCPHFVAGLSPLAQMGSGKAKELGTPRAFPTGTYQIRKVLSTPSSHFQRQDSANF